MARIKTLAERKRSAFESKERKVRNLIRDRMEDMGLNADELREHMNVTVCTRSIQNVIKEPFHYRAEYLFKMFEVLEIDSDMLKEILKV